MTDTTRSEENLKSELKGLEEYLQKIEEGLATNPPEIQKKILESGKKSTTEGIAKIKDEIAKISSNEDTLESVEKKIETMIESLHKENDKDLTDLFSIKTEIPKLIASINSLINIEKIDAEAIVQSSTEKAEQFPDSGNNSTQNTSPTNDGAMPRGGPGGPPPRGGPLPPSRGSRGPARTAFSRDSLKMDLEKLKTLVGNTKKQNNELLQKTKEAQVSLDIQIEEEKFDEAKLTIASINQTVLGITANIGKVQSVTNPINQKSLQIPEIAMLSSEEFTEHLEAKLTKPLQKVISDMESSLASEDWENLYKHKATLDLLCKKLPEQFLSDLTKKPGKGAKKDLSQLGKLLSTSGISYISELKDALKPIEDLLIVSIEEGEGSPKEKKDAKNRLLALDENKLRAYLEQVNKLLTPSPFSEEEITEYLEAAKTIRDYVPTIPEEKEKKLQHEAQIRDWGKNFSSKKSITDIVFLRKIQVLLADYQKAVDAFDKPAVDKIKAAIKKACAVDMGDETNKKKLLKDWMPPAKIIQDPNLINEIKALKEKIDSYKGNEARKKIFLTQLEAKEAKFKRTENPKKIIEDIKTKLSLYCDISTGTINIPTILNNEILLDSMKDALILEGERIEDRNPAYKKKTAKQTTKKEDTVQQKITLPEDSKFIADFETVTILLPGITEHPSDLIKKHDDVPAYTGPKDLFDLQNQNQPENSYQENLQFAFIEKNKDNFTIFDDNELISHISMLATNKKGAFSNLFLMAMATGYLYVDTDINKNMKDGKIDATWSHLTLNKSLEKGTIRFIEIDESKFDDFINLTLEVSKQIKSDVPFLGQENKDEYVANLKAGFKFMLENPEIQLWDESNRKKDVIIYHPDLIAHNELVTKKQQEDAEKKRQENQTKLDEIRSEQKDISSKLGEKQENSDTPTSPSLLTSLFDSKVKRSNNDTLSNIKSDAGLLYKNASTSSLPKLEVKLLIVDLNKTSAEDALKKLEAEAALLVRLETSLGIEQKELERIRDENPTRFAKEGGIQKLENLTSRQQQVVNAKASIDNQLTAVQLKVASSSSSGLSEDKRKTLMISASKKLLESEQEKQKFQQEADEMNAIKILATETAMNISEGTSAVDAIKNMVAKFDQNLDFDKLKIELASQINSLPRQNAQTRAVAKIMNNLESFGIELKKTRPTL